MGKYLFGGFELDLDAHELRRDGTPVKLERRPFDLLVLLVRRQGTLVSRDEIIATLWPPKTVIDFDSGLNTLVRKVRNALGDSPDTPTFIETVPARGYRFIVPVDEVTAIIPKQVSRTDVSPAASPRHWQQRYVVTTVLLLLVVTALLVLGNLFIESSGPTRIAVLPFENLSGDGELKYLASGLAEDTSTALALIDPDRLRVIAGTVGVVSGSEATLARDERIPDVDFIVLSSLRRDQSRIRVATRLLRTSDSEQVWAASFDRELTNVLGLQRDLSIAIAEQIRLRLSPEVAAAIDRRQTQNPAAYALYLRGRYEWMQLTPSSTRRALEYFRQATDADPDYALAWAGLAFGAITASRTADMEPAAAKAIALDALHHAQQLGPELVETVYAQGYYSLFGDLDSVAAARAARQAIRLDPNNAQAHLLLGVSLMRDQSVEALEEMRRARELDPAFALIFANSANVALTAGDPDGALEFARQTVAMSPEFWLGYFYLGAAQQTLGDLDAAWNAFTAAARFSDGHSLTYSARVSLLVSLGRLDEARLLLDELTARAERQYVPLYALAVLHAQLNNTDAAFEWLDRAIEARDVDLTGLPDDVRLQALHDDPRFYTVLARCGCVPRLEWPR
ncbi:MAG: winged helix-turn-helix domain-containing protein [Pseudomonadales bacterium]|nr:winged helix-turn-helix domain-containing protein [Pseudomonadales bacterium]